MDFEEFDRLMEPLRARDAAASLDGFHLIEARTASPEELAGAEEALGVSLPAQYRTFMTRYGGGQFGFLDLIPVSASGSRQDIDDIVSVSREEFPDGAFIAIAPVGTGDYWCFAVRDGQCDERVWFHYHDGGDPEPIADDFLDFVARRGIRPFG